MATAGDVFLGKAMVSPGPGDVSAAVRYAPKKAFSIHLEVDSKDHAQRKEIQAATDAVRAFVMKNVEERGDYGALATEATSVAAEVLSGKNVKVTIDPAGKTSSTQYSAGSVPYAATSDSTFKLAVETTTAMDHQSQATSWTDEEHGGGHVDSDGVRSNMEHQSVSKVATKSTFVSTFAKSLQTNVQNVFANIEKKLNENLDSHTTVVSESTDWTVGIDASKANDGRKDGKAGEDDGVISKTVHTLGGLLYRGVKAIPIIGGALTVAGKLWDVVTTTGVVNRKGTSGKTTTTVEGKPDSDEHLTEVRNLSSFATGLSEEMKAQLETTLEHAYDTKFGNEVTTSQQTTKSDKKLEHTQTTTTVVTHETGTPRISVTKIGA